MAIKNYKKDGEASIGFFCDACGERIKNLTSGGILGDENTGTIYFYHKGTGCCGFIEKKHGGGRHMPWADLYDLFKSLLFEFIPRNKWNTTRTLLKKIFHLCLDKKGRAPSIFFWEEIF